MELQSQTRNQQNDAHGDSPDHWEFGRDGDDQTGTRGPAFENHQRVHSREEFVFHEHRRELSELLRPETEEQSIGHWENGQNDCDCDAQSRKLWCGILDSVNEFHHEGDGDEVTAEHDSGESELENEFVHPLLHCGTSLLFLENLRKDEEHCAHTQSHDEEGESEVQIEKEMLQQIGSEFVGHLHTADGSGVGEHIVPRWHLQRWQGSESGIHIFDGNQSKESDLNDSHHFNSNNFVCEKWEC